MIKKWRFELGALNFKSYGADYYEDFFPGLDLSDYQILEKSTKD